jgi:hypothetical protein
VSKTGDRERVKGRLQQMCCRYYPFIFLDGINKGWFVSSWVYPISGEPHILVSLLYFFLMCFIFTCIFCFLLLLLCDIIPNKWYQSSWKLVSNLLRCCGYKMFRRRYVSMSGIGKERRHYKHSRKCKKQVGGQNNGKVRGWKHL